MPYYDKEGNKLPEDPRDWHDDDRDYVTSYLLKLSAVELERRHIRQKRMAIAGFRQDFSSFTQKALIGRCQLYYDAWRKKMEKKK